MNTVTEIRGIAPTFARALRCEPSILPDLRQADLHVIAAVILFAISIGCDTRDSVQEYLAKRQSPYDSHVIDFMLIGFAGDDQRHSLWRRDENSRYSVLGQIDWRH